ncbi:MAG: phenylacetate--CoA ligase [Phycisphaerae bacterium]|nr:phenylacetate--CoA ligase [Phycisphaerae bacterium]
MEVRYWNQHLETLPHGELRQLQLERLREVVGYALQTPFYQKRLKKVGIFAPEDIRSLEDLKKIPFTVKDDLRHAFPKGLLAVEMEKVVRIHSSSGTTGVPTVIYYTADDLDRWTDLLARSIVATGAGPGDVFQNMMSYGLFTGGLGLHYGAERVGMTVIPVGGGNTQRQLQIMKDFRTTVLHITPSYLLHIYQRMPEFHLTPADLNLKKAWMGSEPHSENTRLKLQDLFGIDIYNSYGLSEMNGPGVAFECVYKNDMHVWEDGYLIEIINPQTGEPVEEGQEGEVVFTNLIRYAMPLLRYRTRDLAFLHPEPCPCGRTSRRISRITGRTDDMLIVNGVNVFPSQIEEVLMSIPDVGTNYQIHLSRHEGLDRLTVKVELYSKLFTGDLSYLEALKAKIKEKLRASITINSRVELNEPGSLPAFEGKAKRVVDEREKL